MISNCRHVVFAFQLRIACLAPVRVEKGAYARLNYLVLAISIQVYRTSHILPVIFVKPRLFGRDKRARLGHWRMQSFFLLAAPASSAILGPEGIRA
jgi:hypothetical protein